MDAVKFIYEVRRRYSETGIVCSLLADPFTPESIVKDLEEWCKEHPRKTRRRFSMDKDLEEWCKEHPRKTRRRFSMDAVKFIYEVRRRYSETGIVCSLLADAFTPESIVKDLEEWCKEHPRKTRQSVFLEQWPNAILADDGVLAYCPKIFGLNTSCLAKYNWLKKCSDCRREFWSKEIE